MTRTQNSKRIDPVFKSLSRGHEIVIASEAKQSHRFLTIDFIRLLRRPAKSGTLRNDSVGSDFGFISNLIENPRVT